MPAISIVRRNEMIKALSRMLIAECIKPLWSYIPRPAYINRSTARLGIALTRICNIRCCFCPYEHIDDPYRINMSENVFERILMNLRQTPIKYVMLSPDLGEPFLVPDVVSKVRVLRECGVRTIEVTTNATRFHSVGVESILEHGPDIINISFPGFEKRMYERICGKPYYEQTRTNILDLLHRNAERGRPKLVNFWLRGDMDADALSSFPEMLEVRQLADDICMMTEVDDWLGMIGQEMLPPGMMLQTQRPSITRRPCVKLFDLTVHPDGNIHLCSCRNILRDPDLQIGNIMDLSLDAAFSKAGEVLSRWEKGVIPKICYKCSMYCDPAVEFAGRFRKTISAAFR